MAKLSPLAERLVEVKDRIAAAANKVGRDPSEVTLVAVTKAAAPEQVREIIQLGVGDLGESRVQVLTQKVAQVNEFFQRRAAAGDATMPSRLRWHLIGHLQRNKVKPVLPFIDLIHSIDSLRLAEELETQATKLGKKIAVLLQINASEEKTKYGIAVGAAQHLADQIASMSNLALVGLMTMAPLSDNPEDSRFVFARTREIFEEIKWHKIGGAGFRHLSMGMSNDFHVAIEEGATLIRLGTVLFGGKTRDQDDGAEE